VKSAAEFRFTQWDDFIQYLEKRNFDYDTESEKLLRQFREQTGKAGYLSEADIKAVESKIIAAKKEELNKYRPLVVNMIEKEIVSRFLYEKGRIQIGLRNDPEIAESVKLLGDQQRYESLLKGK
jgi:carboxyl-terminal processing protease